jgi:hypothetical protein
MVQMSFLSLKLNFSSIQVLLRAGQMVSIAYFLLKRNIFYFKKKRLTRVVNNNNKSQVSGTGSGQFFF